MSCIVGIVANDTVYMGGDSLVSWGDISSPDPAQKVFTKCPVGGEEKILVGYCGSVGASSIMKTAWKVPKLPKKSNNTLAYVIKKLVPSLRSSLDLLTSHSSVITLGIRNELFEISLNFGVSSQGKYSCNGSGFEIALGVLHSLYACEVSHGHFTEPTSKIYHTLTAVGSLVNGVGPPYSHKCLAEENGYTLCPKSKLWIL